MRSLLIAFSAAAAEAFVAFQPITSVWPLPQTFVNGSTVSWLGSSFSARCVTTCPDVIQAAILRYQRMIFLAGENASVAVNASAPQITGVDISISSTEPLSIGVDEYYKLTVPVHGQASIYARTQWGVLRALESLSQLVTWTPTNGSNAYTIGITPVTIVDFPRFPWRGVLLDTSRHWLPVASIKATLDAMSYNKMNVFHWHVVDDNSWPLQSVSYPLFTVGAYTAQTIYTRADVEDIVKYAQERGIVVVPEFDVPGHASAWGRGYPDLVISCDSAQTLVDPTDTGKFYDTLAGLLAEFVPLFKTAFVHFGGDEVESMACWNQSEAVQDFARRMGFPGNMTKVRDYLQTRVQEIAANFSVSPIFWEEVHDQGYHLQPAAIIDAYMSDDQMVDVIKSGYRAINSNGYYLDQQTPLGDTHYYWQDTFLNFWLHDPLYNRTDIPPEAMARMLGISASQWGEQINAGNVQSRMWPRACGAAERMWSDMNDRDETTVFARLEAQSCHMAQRGIGCGPLRPANNYGFCSMPDWSRFQAPHNPWSA